jgi:hypothetical protein
MVHGPAPGGRTEAHSPLGSSLMDGAASNGGSITSLSDAERRATAVREDSN